MFNKLDLECIERFEFNKLNEMGLIARSYDSIYKIIFSGLINFDYSLDEPQGIPSFDDKFDIIDIKHQYGNLNKEHLKYYDYKVNDLEKLTKYHYVEFYGDGVIIILSQDIKINKL